jgi:sugar lactone lactonase YvrE
MPANPSAPQARSASDWQVVFAQPNELGESPFWHPLEQMLYWVDIPARKLLRGNIFMGTAQVWDLPQDPGCVAPAASGGLIVALRDGVYRAREWGGALTLIRRFDYDTATTRFNDGKADPQGRLWAGTMYEPRTQADAELYCIDCRDGRTPDVQTKARNATIANGLAWSPDGGTMYWADTIEHIVRAWNLNAHTTDMSQERVFHQFPAKPADWQYGKAGQAAYGGRPDGAAVDVQGNYYVAMFEGQQLLKLSPTGQVLERFALPVQCPTMPCFGGDDLRTLYLTSARYNRSAQELADFPASGCVLSLRVDVPGLPVNFFRD